MAGVPEAGRICRSQELGAASKRRIALKQHCLGFLGATVQRIYRSKRGLLAAAGVRRVTWRVARASATEWA